MTLAALLERPFTVPEDEKQQLLVSGLMELEGHHRAACSAYARYSKARFGDVQPEALADLPFIPVGVFKSHLLASVPEAEIVKILTSSGTTGQEPSRVPLDRPTAERQTRALASIMSRVLGNRRLPMLIVDSPAVLRDRRQLGARGAGVAGMMNFGRRPTWLLDDQMVFRPDRLRSFLSEYGSGPFLIFGFTFMVWRYLYEEVGVEADLRNAILVHGGGWKALIEQAVGPELFAAALSERTGLRSVHNFYGMAEQVGSVFLEGPDGWLHAPSFADVMVRDPVSLEPVPDGQPGVVQLVSLLPTSYPGHSILTEDLGVTGGIGDCEDGWGGRRVRIHGRIPRSELRGCSDTFAARVT